MAPLDRGVYIVMGEMNTLVTAMRKGNRWGSHGHQDEDQDCLLRSFTNLREVLSHIQELSELEPNVFLTPFLDMVRSQDTTGPVTGLALSSINKFLSYDMIDAKCETALSAVEHIADAVTHARFVGTDPASDEVVLMKILQVLRTLLLTSAGLLLTNESICEIMQSCFRICFETRLSELLRKAAEHALVDMVQLLFCRLPTFTEDTKYISMRKLKMKAGGMDTTRTTKKRRSPRPKKHVIAAASTTTTTPSSQETSSTSLAEPIPGQGGTPTSSSVANSVESGFSCDRSSREASEPPPVCNSTCIDMSAADDSPHIGDGEMLSSNSIQDISFTSQNTESVNGFESCLAMSESTTDLRRSWEAVDSCVDSTSGSIPNGDESILLGSSDFPDLSLAKEGDYINPRGVRFTAQQAPREGTGPLIPYGLPCVRELFRFLLSLINPLDKQNTEVMTHIGLSLLTVALECGADHIGGFNCLLALVKDEMCRNLFSLLHTDRISIFSSSLRVCFLLFESLRTHLKFQLEMFLTRLMDIIVSETPRISYEQREIALDSVVQLWRIPGLVTELYLNYDCDLYCSNLFEDLTKMLSKNAFPVSGLYSTHLLSLDTLLTVIESIESHCHVRMLYENQVEEDISMPSQDVSSFQDQSNTNSEANMTACALSSLQPSGFIMSKSVEQRSQNQGVGKLALASHAQRAYHIKANRMKPSALIASHEELMAIKNKKKLLAAGTEHFKTKPAKGIAFLQEHNLLSDPLDSVEVATFLRDNPKLDKHMIGEYVSNRKNLKILEAFIRSFNFEDTRIDEALRMYLETFRLPGEAPLISLLMEHFAEHWHRSNGEPFANSDAAFTLAYAIIMLNVDQHNHNVKKQNIPMTLEEFKKNLKNVNGGQDFDSEMLEEVFNAIKNEEIVMPAEQTGLVKENYLWKVLLRRGRDKEGVFFHAPNGLLDRDLFSLCWGPTVAALSFVFDKSSDGAVIQKAIAGFRKCAMISAHYGMSDVFDNLVISLCKYTTFLSASETPESLPVSFGLNPKAQLAARTVFNLAHRHGDILREGWKNLLECILQLFRAKLLPREMIEAEDFLAPKGYVVLIRDELPILAPRMESGLFSSFYSYITLTADSQAQRLPTPEEEASKQVATDCISQCLPEQLITESKFLRLDSLQELTKALIYQRHCPDQNTGSDLMYDEDCAVFLLELLIKVVLQNRDRASYIWPTVHNHLYKIMMTSANNDCSYLLERTVVGMLRISIRMMRKEDMAPEVLDSLNRLMHLRSSHLYQVSRQVSYALFELLRTSAANIHSEQEWSTLFTLLECVGAGAKPPQHLWCSSTLSCNSQDTCDTASDSGAQSDSEVSRRTQDSGLSTDRGYTSDSELYEGGPGGKHHQHHHHHQQHRGSVDSVSSGSGWILVGREGEIEQVQVRPLPVNQYNIILEREMQAHDPHAFTKSCETLAFLVRDVTHITPQNFQSCIHCIRTFVEASLNGGIGFQKRRTAKDTSKDRRSPRFPAKREKDSRMKRSKSSPTHMSLGYESDSEDATPEPPPAYQEASIQLLDFMHTLHTRAAHVFESWAAEMNGESDLKPSLWITCWCPLLQGIARLCCDKRRSVRTSALTYLQRALLNHDLQVLSAIEWEACFNQVLFPLLAKLLENINSQDRVGMEETRVRVATLLCKVFLQHLNPLLSLSTFTALWLTILDFMDKYMHADSNDLLSEAIPESLKNMLLVMDTAGIFQRPDENRPENLEEQQLWHITWDRINLFLPDLRDEVFKKPVQQQQQQQHQQPVSAPEVTTEMTDVVVCSVPEVANDELPPVAEPLQATSPTPPAPVTVMPSCVTPSRSPSLSMVLPPVSMNHTMITTSLPSSSVILHPPTAPGPCNILISQQNIPTPHGMNVTGPPLPLILDPALVGSTTVSGIFSQTSATTKPVLPR